MIRLSQNREHRSVLQRTYEEWLRANVVAWPRTPLKIDQSRADDANSGSLAGAACSVAQMDAASPHHAVGGVNRGRGTLHQYFAAKILAMLAVALVGACGVHYAWP